MAGSTASREGAPRNHSPPSPPGKVATEGNSGDNRSSTASALQQVLEGASRRRSAGLPPTASRGASNKNSKNSISSMKNDASSATLGTAAALAPVLGSRRASSSLLLSPRERRIATVPQAQGLDPPRLGRSTSLQLDPPPLGRSSSVQLVAAIPPGLRPSQSLDLGPPSLGRSSSLELAAAAGRRRAVALNGTTGAAAGYPGAMYDPRRLFLAQQAAAATSAGFMASPAMMVSGAGFGSMVMGMGVPSAALWRSNPNQGVSGQGLELLRAASMALPNRGAAAAASSNGSGVGSRAGDALMAVAGGSGSHAGAAPSSLEACRKRKASDRDSSDDEDEGGVKVFIPEVRDLDILCGRGGKSNHHFGYVH